MGRKLIAQSVKARDFLSYAAEQELLLGGRGPMAIVGPNGAGKSTIASKAVTWCLYGQTSPERMGGGTHKLKGKGVLRDGATECCVEVILTADDDLHDSWLIRRSRKKAGSDVLAVYTSQAGAAWVHVPEFDQEAIEVLLGANAETFVRTVVRGQNDPWSFAEATDGKKREILDSVSGSKVLDIAHHKAKTIKQAKQALCERLLRQIEDLGRRLTAMRVDSLEAEVQSWETSREGRKREAEAAVQQAHEHFEHAKRLDAETHAMAQRRAEVESQRPAVDWEPYDQAIQHATAQHAQTMTRHRELDKQRMYAQELLDQGNCPTCGQHVRADSHVGQQATAATAELAQMEGAGAAMFAHLQTCQQRKTDAQAWLTAEELRWQGALDATPAPPGEPQTPQAQQYLTTAQKGLGEVQAAENPWTHALAQEKAGKLTLDREVAICSEQLESAQKDLSCAQGWEDTLAPKGARAHLAESALAGIEIEANKWLSVLSAGKMTVQFPSTKTTGKGVVREEIAVVVRHNGQERPLLAFSGGEKRRINLAVDLGVAAVFSRGGGLSLSLLVLDEENLSGLDAQGKGAVATALHHMGVADIVLIDHDPSAVGALNRTVLVERGADGWSQVREVA